MDLELKNKKVLVTGSSRGIGYGIAESFLKEGAQVVLTGRDENSLNEAFLKLSAQFPDDRCEKFCADLLMPQSVNDLNTWLLQHWGKLDHLVCNIGSGRSVPPLQEDYAEFERMININLKSAMLCVSTLLPLLKAKSLNNTDMTTITLIGSICGSEVLGCPVGYATAKAALVAYAKNIARPLARSGTRVNVISPGNIVFPGSTWELRQQQNPQAVAAMLNDQVPLNRLGTVAEIADIAVFLASSRASFVTGANWVVDGGQIREL